MSFAHHKRPALDGVVHVTQKICAGLPRMRTKATFHVVAAAVRAGNEKPGFRVCAFTMMSNHFHLLVEADDNESLARGMQGLAVRVARALNRRWGRTGKVFRERYFAQTLRTAGAMRRALVYVLQNARRHGVRLARKVADPFSSAAWYRFWRERLRVRDDASPVVMPRHLTLGVILTNGIGIGEVPAGSGP